jgi:hypothetical protein
MLMDALPHGHVKKISYVLAALNVRVLLQAILNSLTSLVVK